MVKKFIFQVAAEAPWIGGLYVFKAFFSSFYVYFQPLELAELNFHIKSDDRVSFLITFSKRIKKF